MDAMKARVITNHLQAGVIQKSNLEASVEFEVPFVHPPVVVITPAWEKGGVAAPETLHSVNREGFTLYSGDRDPVYYVHWIAVGDVE